MTCGRGYVIGAGLAGLSASVALANRGAKVRLIEGGGQAGGRCRSYFDPVLNHTIDNGNHLVLSGNHATMTICARSVRSKSSQGRTRRVSTSWM